MKPSLSVSSDTGTQLYFFRDDYHSVPFIPVMDEAGRRKLFSDVRRVMIEKSIEEQLLGDNASSRQLLALHDKYDRALWEALGIHDHAG